MTLATHAVTGSLIAAIASQNIPLALSAAFLSHFIFDTIPHWDYPIGSIAKKGINIDNDMNLKGKTFLLDISKIAFDGVIGLTLVTAAFYAQEPRVLIVALLGACFAMVPDPLQFVYWKLRPRLMKPLQTFHMWMHSRNHLLTMPIFGILSQTAIIAVSLVMIHVIYG